MKYINLLDSRGILAKTGNESAILVYCYCVLEMCWFKRFWTKRGENPGHPPKIQKKSSSQTSSPGCCNRPILVNLPSRARASDIFLISPLTEAQCRNWYFTSQQRDRQLEVISNKVEIYTFPALTISRIYFTRTVSLCKTRIVHPLGNDIICSPFFSGLN